MEVTDLQISKLKHLGVEVHDPSEDVVKHTLVTRLRTEITDISDIYSVSELINLYEAIFGHFEGVVETYDPEAKPKERKPDPPPKSKRKRKKIRIDLTQDISYVTPLLEHLRQFDELAVNEIKTGLAIKYTHGGYRSNVMNYLELRTISGVVYGNLYFNMVKSEEQLDDLNIYHDHKWFRTYAMIPKISIDEVVDYLNKDAIEYLIGINQKAHKRKRSNAKRLMHKLR